MLSLYPNRFKRGAFVADETSALRGKIIFKKELEEMDDKEKLEEETSTEERLKGIGQEILGDLEILGGMLTGDGISTAEGKFNAGVGEIRQESSEALEETDEEE